MSRQPSKDEIRRAIEEAHGSEADIGSLRLRLLGSSYALDYIMAYPKKDILKALADLGWAIKVCKECGEPFIPRQKAQKYHSPKCGNRARVREWRGKQDGTPAMV